MKIVEYLLFLNWPERCFRVSPEDIRYLKSLLPRSARVRSVNTERAFLKALPSATHVVTWHFRREWYALAPRVKVVATPAAGRELVQLPPPETKRPPLVHFGAFHGAIMSESVAAFVLAWSRGFFHRGSFGKCWPRRELSEICREVAGTKAIVFGYGNVGRAIGEKLSALGIAVEGYSRHRPLPVGKLDCDWFVMALPSTTGTDNLVNAALLRRLPRRAVLVNVGRGNAVDEKALERALRGGRLAGAYLDVLKVEPTAAELMRPGAVRAFLEEKVPNAVVMPHASAFSPAYLRHCFAELSAHGIFHA